MQSTVLLIQFTYKVIYEVIKINMMNSNQWISGVSLTREKLMLYWVVSNRVQYQMTVKDATHTHTHTHKHTRTHARMHARSHTRTHARMHTHTRTCACACTLRMCLCLSVSISVSLCLSVCLSVSYLVCICFRLTLNVLASMIHNDNARLHSVFVCFSLQYCHWLQCVLRHAYKPYPPPHQHHYRHHQYFFCRRVLPLNLNHHRHHYCGS